MTWPKMYWIASRDAFGDRYYVNIEAIDDIWKGNDYWQIRTRGGHAVSVPVEEKDRLIELLLGVLYHAKDTRP